MKVNQRELYDFLNEIGEYDLAVRFEGVVTATPISTLTLNCVTTDILDVFFSKLIRLDKPSDMNILDFDRLINRAQSYLQKPEHPSSIDAWLKVIKMYYIDMYRQIKG